MVRVGESNRNGPYYDAKALDNDLAQFPGPTPVGRRGDPELDLNKPISIGREGGVQRRDGAYGHDKKSAEGG